MTVGRTRVTGVGSLPGTDFDAAVRLVVEACPELVPFPELPARGPHAAMIGRGLALLDGLDAALEAGEWRLASRPGADLRRARQTWRDDLDRFEEAAAGREGTVKVGVAGPWTLSASVLRPRGGHLLADRGARRDLAQALAQGVDEFRGMWRRRFGDDVIVQVDEPALVAVLDGAVPTEGGYFRHRAVERTELLEGLRTVGGDVLHSCAANVPIGLLLEAPGAGITGISLDADAWSARDLEALGAGIETGITVYCGCVPTAGRGPAPDVDALTRRVEELARALGVEGRDDRLVLTPACGLAGWRPADVPGVFRGLATAARRLDEG